MRTNLLFVSGFSAIVAIVLLMRQLDQDPENHILGNWTEVLWSYEKMDHTHETDLGWLEEMDDHVKAELSKSLIIHEAEQWNFQPNKKLVLLGKPGGKTNVSWKLTGRGNILELRYDSTTVEYYTIQDISEEEMVLHFNSDLQTRGIVKMVFSRNKSAYAEK